MSKKAIEKVTGTVEVKVNPMLETFNGFNDDECVNAIQNADMKKAVLAYRKATTRLEGGKWDMAKAAARMKVEARKEFGSDDRLASFLGLSGKGAFNKLRRVGEYAKEAQELGLSVSVAMELLVLENAKCKTEGTLVDRMTYAANEGLTVAEAREYAKNMIVKDDAKKAADKPKKDAKKGDAKKVQDAIKTVQDEDKEAAEETEERWMSVLEITEEALTKINRKEFELALQSMCEAFGIGDLSYVKNLH